jgi:predicted O-linked N-acetylglucosamine transferase (SPINDLY family)
VTQGADRHLARGRESEAAGRLHEALQHYQAAVAAAPAHTAALLDLGSVLEVLGRTEEAVRAFEAALASAPHNAYANYNLGRLLLLAHQLPRAESLLRAALAARRDFPEALVALAGVLEARGDLEGALQALDASIVQRPDYAGALKNRGALLGRLERWAEAADALRRAAGLDPGDADALYWLGNAHVKRGEPELALAAYRGATDRRPEFAEAWCNQGNVLADGGRREEALACFARALELKPDSADAHLGLGNVLGVGERQEEAAAHFRRALALNPRLALAHLNLGILLVSQGRKDEALDSMRTALALHPDWPEARWAYAVAHVPTVRGREDGLPGVRRGIARAFEELGRWFDTYAGPDAHRAVGVQQPFWLAYQEEDNRPLLEPYGRLCARLMGEWQARHARQPRAARLPGKIRVGVVSQHLRNHSVWHALVRGWFQQLDAARFSLIAFCLDPQEDEETRLARARAARFEQGHIGLERWSEVIADAQPDVLIYPEIGMDPMSLKLAGQRLARLQAVSWGHPETTGLPTIDCFLSADAMEPAGAERNYSERLVRLPHLGCYLEPQEVPSDPAERARWGIEPDVPLLVCPGTPFKYAPEHDGVYAEIARRLGRCRLVFFRYWVRALSERVESRLREAFAARGLDFERHVTFVPWQEESAFYGLLGAADVCIDTIGFSGFNTALRAIECGLPVVTIEGRFLRGRLASGILRRMALDELVASGPEQYVELAVRLARNADRREAVRRRIREARPLLFGDLEPIRALEDFLAQGW